MFSTSLKIAPQSPGSNGPIYSLSADVKKTIPAGSLYYFVQMDKPARYRISSRESLLIWRQYHNEWQQETDINNEYVHLAVEEQDIIAIAATHDNASIHISPIDPPRLLIDQFYGENLSAMIPLPGQALVMVIDSINMLEGEPLPDAAPIAFFEYTDRDGDSVPVALSMADEELYQQLDINSPYRHVMRLEIPKTLTAGWGELTINWGALSSGTVAIEISTEGLLKVRQAFIEENLSGIQERLGADAYVSGYYNPLPTQSIITHGLSDKVVTQLPKGQWLLYFAASDATFFHQDNTLWMMLNVDTGQMIEYEMTDWPVVLSPVVPSEGLPERLSERAPELESPELIEQNDDNENPQAVFCGCGIGPQESESHKLKPFDFEKAIEGIDFPPITPIPSTPKSPAPEPLPKKEPIRTGAFLEEQAGCKVIRKIALLIQLNDNTATHNDKGEPIPDFNKVIAKEEVIAKKLGCEPIIILKPDEFLPKGGEKFDTPKKNGFNSFKAIKTTLEAQIAAQEDCCYEIIVFLNAHQNKENGIIFSNAKQGIKKSIDLPTLCFLIADTIRNASKGSCQVTSEIIIHSCYSGKFGDSDLTNANTAGTGITASSSGTQTTKGRSGYYYFLEALQACIEEFPKKTLTDIFPCIVKKTEKLARDDKKQQTPKRKPPKPKADRK